MKSARGFTLALALGAVVATGSRGEAVEITYNTLHNNVSAVDSLNPDQWIFWAGALDYWHFYGIANEVVTITGRRLQGDLDPAFYVFQGDYATTEQVAGLIQNSKQLGFADDELPANPGVPSVGTPSGGDPRLTITLPSTGAYTIGFGSYSDGSVRKLYGYSLVASGIQDFPSDYDPTKTESYNSAPTGVQEVIPFLSYSSVVVPEGGTTFTFLFMAALGLLALRPRSPMSLLDGTR